MKRNIVIFLIVTVIAAAVFSISGCGEKAATPGNANSGKAGNPNNADPGKKEESVYPPLKGDVADAEMETMDGGKTKISDRKGNVVLVNLWGIWCGPCRAEMPHLIELQNKYKDKGFQTIGLNIGDDDGNPEDIGKIKEFGEKTGLNYELTRGSREMKNSIFRLANFDGVPLSLLIDRDGHLRAVLRGGGPAAIKQLKDNVDKVMAE
ncbi:MAG: TlpA family protein disulfide reductase [Pyrinomonadaceae bacterium]|nr:TlpA family protein disulfide reductase [Pyrinomonadaceae bacterium]